MCCAVLLAFGIGPRVALVLVWLFGDRIDRAFDSWVWPLLGLLLLPWTTLMYIIVSVTLFGALLGVLGALTAVPLAATIQILVQELTKARREKVAEAKAAIEPPEVAPA